MRGIVRIWRLSRGEVDALAAARSPRLRDDHGWLLLAAAPVYARTMADLG
jgi:hypothetical protein